MSGRVNKFVGFVVNPSHPSVIKERVKDLVWILLRVGLGYFEPETIAGECLVVVFFGYVAN